MIKYINCILTIYVNGELCVHLLCIDSSPFLPRRAHNHYTTIQAVREGRNAYHTYFRARNRNHDHARDRSSVPISPDECSIEGCDRHGHLRALLTRRRVVRVQSKARRTPERDARQAASHGPASAHREGPRSSHWHLRPRVSADRQRELHPHTADRRPVCDSCDRR